MVRLGGSQSAWQTAGHGTGTGSCLGVQSAPHCPVLEDDTGPLHAVDEYLEEIVTSTQANMISRSYSRQHSLNALSKVTYERTDDDEEEAARERRRRARQERQKLRDDVDGNNVNSQNSVTIEETRTTSITNTDATGDDEAALLERLAKREERRQKRLKEAMERQKEYDPTISITTNESYSESKSTRNGESEVQENDTAPKENDSEPFRRKYEVEETDTVEKPTEDGSKEEEEEEEVHQVEVKEEVQEESPEEPLVEENQVEVTFQIKNVEVSKAAVDEEVRIEAVVTIDKSKQESREVEHSESEERITIEVERKAEEERERMEEKDKHEAEERERLEAERKAEELKREEDTKREAERQAAEERERLEEQQKEKERAEERERQKRLEEERRTAELKAAAEKKAEEERIKAEQKKAEEEKKKREAEEKKAAEEKKKAEEKKAAEEKARLEAKKEEEKNEKKQVKEKKAEEKIQSPFLKKQGEDKENKFEAKKDEKGRAGFKKEEVKDEKARGGKEELKASWERKKGFPESKAQNGESLHEATPQKLKHADKFGGVKGQSSIDEPDAGNKVEAGKKLDELRRRRGETETGEFDKLKQKHQESAAELEELKKRREERKKHMEEEEQKKKQEEAERKAREEEEKKKMKEEIERRRAEAAEKRQKLPDEGLSEDKKAFKCFTPKGSSFKIEERAEFLNRSSQKSTKAAQPAVVSKIDSRLEQYTSAVGSNKSAKPTKAPPSDLPLPADGVRNIKSMWEKGNVFSSPGGVVSPNKETAGLKVGVSSRINEWLTKTPETNKTPSAKPADLRPGDVSGKRNLWEKQPADKPSSPTKMAVGGKKSDSNGLRFEKEP
ncbi:caldesmon isoform X1 [Hyperolius riggenbachi]|uniref:caldesmon isoform X1 n=1 Tax=Hyperolius riggenbachi TaxID=752182 RepID=UPI0035A2E520